ncbi:MAG TPA: hypothetical protein DD671_05560 [Balneolaceae bacterium]|nr:hypothetical protein [Balneola sp.]HBQ59092.1 hypothetical protein [Balneolaceae bacterium]|tara:strand:+ start:12832 stop:13308 length:477 start_codon:yes stop_codon:yes gene_type:complete
MKTQFRAPWDGMLIMITTVIVLILVGLDYFNEGWISTVISWSIIFGSAAFGVYGYSLQDGQLRILRLGWSKDIEFSEIKSVELKPDAMMGSFRKWGIGGFFSYLGYFSNRILGDYKAYATHRKRTVLITTTKNDQIVVTPDNPEEFVVCLEKARSDHS